jgi:hypothetical protein
MEVDIKALIASMGRKRLTICRWDNYIRFKGTYSKERARD